MWVSYWAVCLVINSRKFYMIAWILGGTLEHVVVLNVLGHIPLAWLHDWQVCHCPWGFTATLNHEYSQAVWQTDRFRYWGDLIWILSFYFRIWNMRLCYYDTSKTPVHVLFIAGKWFYQVFKLLHLEFFLQVLVTFCVFAVLWVFWLILTQNLFCTDFSLVNNIFTRHFIIYSRLGGFATILQFLIKILSVLV